MNNKKNEIMQKKKLNIFLYTFFFLCKQESKMTRKRKNEWKIERKGC